MQFHNQAEWQQFLDDNNGSAPAYAWPGGYPMAYLAADGSILSPDAVNAESALISDSWADADDQWKIVAAFVHWEGDPLICDHTGKEIESAFGPTDSDD